MKVKLPITESDMPAENWCTQCGKRRTTSQCVLSGGAMLLDREEDSGGPDDNMDGFLALVSDSKRGYYTVEIMFDVRGGQFDVYFCSTQCMRAFLNECVDVLEDQIKRGESDDAY